ncbi:MAG: hypothetical protein ABIF82_04725 [Planctomycetota bacterium]
MNSRERVFVALDHQEPDRIPADFWISKGMLRKPEAAGMAPEALEAEFGGRVCFQGGVCIQKTMPFGSRGDIRAAVDRLAGVTDKGGGYY